MKKSLAKKATENYVKRFTFPEKLGGKTLVSAKLIIEYAMQLIYAICNSISYFCHHDYIFLPSTFGSIVN